jgi:hypothetical protein
MKAFVLLAKILLPVLLILAVIIGVPALRSNKKEAAESHTFYYYPKANVYYNLEEQLYIYPDSIGQAWLTGKELPENRQVGLDKNITLYSPALPVWKDNELHRIVYAVALYALPSDFIEEKPSEPDYSNPPSDENIKKNKPAKKKESGIKRFFRKLFGGKDSRDE